MLPRCVARRRGVAPATSKARAKACLGDRSPRGYVASGTIALEHAAVVRGRVLLPDGATGAAGVKATVVGHPEYGYTLTRADGYYDLAVNGGGVLTVSLVSSFYLTVQRTTSTPWRDFVT